MQYLVRLITPPGGTVLDPFGGSGSTMVAADREGFHGIYIDMDDEYAAIARKRVYGDAPLFAEVAD
jgi:site-specific DNA-methyltransferase (adenine-specific)